MNTTNQTAFVPMLWIRNGVKDIEFYKHAFGAVELRRINNDDGSIHVAEMAIDGALFQVHEVTMYNPHAFHPQQHNGVTTTIGLMVDNADIIMDRAISAGATELAPAEDYDYGYRQGEVTDPFGHVWLIQQVL